MRELTVTIGLQTIGHIRIRDDRVEALDTGGAPIGAFPTEEKARLAIWQSWRARADGGADATF